MALYSSLFLYSLFIPLYSLYSALFLQLLMVQVAVPKGIVESANPEDFVIESLYGANAVAFEFFRQKNMDFPLAEAERLVASIESRMKKAA